MKTLPNCVVNINMALYLRTFVYWDTEREKYVSHRDDTQKWGKIDLILDMFKNDNPECKGKREEFEWILKVERDNRILRIVRHCLSNLSA